MSISIFIFVGRLVACMLIYGCWRRIVCAKLRINCCLWLRLQWAVRPIAGRYSNALIWSTPQSALHLHRHHFICSKSQVQSANMQHKSRTTKLIKTLTYVLTEYTIIRQIKYTTQIKYYRVQSRKLEKKSTFTMLFLKVVGDENFTVKGSAFQSK